MNNKYIVFKDYYALLLVKVKDVEPIKEIQFYNGIEFKQISKVIFNPTFFIISKKGNDFTYKSLPNGGFSVYRNNNSDIEYSVSSITMFTTDIPKYLMEFETDDVAHLFAEMKSIDWTNLE